MRKKKKEFVSVGDHVSIYTHSDFWYINYIDNGRQIRRSLKTKNERTARGKAAKIETQLCEGNGPTFIKAASVDEVIQAYLDFLKTEDRSKKTLAKYEYTFRMVTDLCGQMHIQNITGMDCRFMDKFRQQRTEQGRAKKTVYTESVIIRQLIKFAVNRKMLNADTMAGYKLKKPKTKEQNCWGTRDIEKILKNSSGMAKNCFEILWMTGIRVGELCHLEWRDVNLPQNTISIRPKEFEGVDQSGRKIKGSWKTKNGEKRTVPIPPRLEELLANMPHSSNWVVTRHPIDGKNLRQMSDRWLLAQLKRILKKLDMKGHIHTFRHSFVSHAIVNGKVPADVVREWVGHLDPEILKNYTHVSEHASRDYMAKLFGSEGNHEVAVEEIDNTATNGTVNPK